MFELMTFKPKTFTGNIQVLSSISLSSRSVDRRSKREKTRNVPVAYKHHLTTVYMKRAVRPGTMQIRKYSMFTDSPF